LVLSFRNGGYKCVYLGSLLHYGLHDHHDVEARIKKASHSSGAMRRKIYTPADIPGRLKGKVYAGGVLAVLLYGCESWCLTAESVRRLSNWHNKRIREMCRVTMCQTFVNRITSESLQKDRIDMDYCIAKVHWLRCVR